MAQGHFTLNNPTPICAAAPDADPAEPPPAWILQGLMQPCRNCCNGYGFSTVSENVEDRGITETDFFNHTQDKDLISWEPTADGMFGKT